MTYTKAGRRSGLYPSGRRPQQPDGDARDLQAEVDRLRLALLRFGHHITGCATRLTETPVQCDCGFQSALDALGNASSIKADEP